MPSPTHLVSWGVLTLIWTILVIAAWPLAVDMVRSWWDAERRLAARVTQQERQPW